MEQSKINRINELARLSKTRKFTKDELHEQGLLRAEFISEIKADLRATLDSIDYVEEAADTIMN